LAGLGGALQDWQSVSDLLDRIERYYDAVPRSGARAEQIGPFTIFVSHGGWPYYARPTLGLQATFDLAAVDRVRARQRELGIPETFEWVDEIAPDLGSVIRRSGLPVQEHPLMILEQPMAAPIIPDVTVRILAPDDRALAVAEAVAAVSFAAGGVQVGHDGTAERDAQAAAMPEPQLERRRERLRRGLTVTAVAEDGTGPLAVGSHQPVGGVTEIVGVATLPAARRRGLGAAVTAALVEDARQRGVDLVFLSAGSADVARIYERVGFRRVATACIATNRTA
jgi:ribosomal protein S18 acetylase RimI-like enzyme